MKKKYSKRLLRCLRNDLPIDLVITVIIKLPIKRSEGYIRFLCPLCRGFNTGIKMDTNLARCFSCQRNYNPIEIYMVAKNKTFRDSVEYLISWILTVFRLAGK